MLLQFALLIAEEHRSGEWFMGSYPVFTQTRTAAVITRDDETTGPAIPHSRARSTTSWNRKQSPGGLTFYNVTNRIQIS